MLLLCSPRGLEVRFNVIFFFLKEEEDSFFFLLINLTLNSIQTKFRNLETVNV